MTAHFDIAVEPARNLVRITLSGFFTTDDIARFAMHRDRTHQLLKCDRNEHVTLVDIRDMQIQSQEAVAEFKSRLGNPAMASKRLAIVVAKSLARLQVQRAAADRDVHYFSTIKDAEGYLFH